MREAAESAPRLRAPVNEHACAVAVVSAEAELSFAQVKAQPIAPRLYQRLHSATRVSRIISLDGYHWRGIPLLYKNLSGISLSSVYVLGGVGACSLCHCVKR